MKGQPRVFQEGKRASGHRKASDFSLDSLDNIYVREIFSEVWSSWPSRKSPEGLLIGL